MAIPGDPTPTYDYGIRLKLTPDLSGANPSKTYTVLYRSTSSGGTYTKIAANFGAAVWYFDDPLPNGSGRKYYKLRSESSGYTASSYIGPVDALPAPLTPL